MKSSIEKISEINHPNLEIMRNYFENYKNSKKDFPGAMVFTVYKKKGFEKYDYNIEDDLYNGHLKMKVDKEIIDKIYEFSDFLKQIYDIDILWLRFYNPKSYIEFHVDETSNKHCITLCGDEKFYNYESKQISSSNNILYTKKLNEFSTEIEKFNQFFLEHNPENNRIINFEPNNVYCFNFSLHSFYNDSEKLRVNFIFEKGDSRFSDKEVREHATINALN